MPGATPTAEQFADVMRRLSELEAARAQVTRERDEYRQAYVVLLEAYRKLEAGLAGPKRERFAGTDEQLALSLLSMLTQGAAPPPAMEQSELQKVEAHERRKPTGRKPLPDNLPRVRVEVLPLEVQREGLDAFERIGDERREVVERRPASLVVVETVRPKFIRKKRPDGLASATGPSVIPDKIASAPVMQSSALELPIPRAMCGPNLLADGIVRRWHEYTPLHRMERIYGREGLELARSTLCDWHAAAAQLVSPLVRAMRSDAITHAPYLCCDATGVLVQAKHKCRRGHFFVMVAPGRHVFFEYSPEHDAAAVDRLLAGYKGYLVADAHAVYDHLYEDGKVIESACWAHARRYWFKALDTDGQRARHGLSFIRALFMLERKHATSPPEERLQMRKAEARPIVEAFFAYCDEESLRVLDETPIARAIGYARNQREPLKRFLDDGRLPIHNNFSENALRKEALGRKNWLFLGSDEGGEVNATFVTLLASCQMHGIEPMGYLRDLFCLIPGWNVQRNIDLAPMNWRATIQRPEVLAELQANVYRQAALGELQPTDEPTIIFR